MYPSKVHPRLPERHFLVWGDPCRSPTGEGLGVVLTEEVLVVAPTWEGLGIVLAEEVLFVFFKLGVQICRR